MYMQALLAEIRNLTQALSGLQTDTIIIENLDKILVQLKGSDIQHQIEEYKLSQPSVPEDEQALESYKETMKDRADTLNKESDHFLDELERIKTIRHTLNLEALDPIIKEARRVIHVIHGFTTGLED
jgi:hypothetical protein